LSPRASSYRVSRHPLPRGLRTSEQAHHFEDVAIHRGSPRLKRHQLDKDSIPQWRAGVGSLHDTASRLQGRWAQHCMSPQEGTVRTEASPKSMAHQAEGRDGAHGILSVRN